MSAMLPVAYAAVLFLSGTTFGFFVWAWFRGNAEIDSEDYRRHTERLRDTVQQEQQRSAWLQKQLAEQTSELGRVEHARKKHAHQFGMIRDLAKERKQRLLAATERGDRTLELLQKEQNRCETLDLNLKSSACELDLANDRIARLLIEKSKQQERERETSTRLAEETANVERLEAAISELHRLEKERVKTERVEEAKVAKVAATEISEKVVEATEIDSTELDSTEVAAVEEDSLQPTILKFSSESETADAVEPALANRSYDPTRGVIYQRRPAEVDDLKLIAGIAEKLELKLHEQGVYTFEQIMLWDDAAVAEFSTRLKTFKDRIQRNNWVDQARFLYDQKAESVKVSIPMQKPDTEVA